MIRITELAQQQIAQVLREGDVAVDATAGAVSTHFFWPPGRLARACLCIRYSTGRTSENGSPFEPEWPGAER